MRNGNGVLAMASGLLLLGACSSGSGTPGALTENDFTADGSLYLQPEQTGVTFLEATDAPSSGAHDTRIPGVDIIPFEVKERTTHEYVLDARGSVSHAVIATGGQLVAVDVATGRLGTLTGTIVAKLADGTDAAAIARSAGLGVRFVAAGALGRMAGVVAAHPEVLTSFAVGK